MAGSKSWVEDSGRRALRRKLIAIGVEPAKDLTVDPCDVAIKSIDAMQEAFKQTSMALDLMSGAASKGKGSTGG
ncbi:hypothetical protein SEA_MARGARET_73 [Gordonia phage Margaret]|nr:hypothetical protein SEA_MARGARET_73 [Gordonia phage Margaret]